MPLRPMKLKKYKGILELYSKATGAVTGYYVSYRDAGGKAQKHRVDALDREEALEKLNQLKHQVKRDKHRSGAKTTIKRDAKIDDLAVEYFIAKVDNVNNIKAEAKYKNHLSALVGGLKAVDLKPQDVSNIQSLLKAKLGAKSINIITDMLRSIMRFSVANRYVPADTYKMDGYKKLQVDNLVDFVFTPNQVRELISSIPHERLKLFVQMAYFTAQRPASLLKLQKKDINLGAQSIMFSAIKKQKSHEVSIHSDILQPLEEWMKDLDDDDYIFYGMNGKNKPISYERLQAQSSKLFEPYNKKFYYKDGMTKEEEALARAVAYKEHRKKWVSLYTLRHSAATAILTATGNIAVAGSVLNHSDTRMTARYATVVSEKKKEGIDAL